VADGLELNAGSGGATLATDDAGVSGHVQIVKLAQSADASASPITADAGGLLVNLGTNNDVTVTGTVTVDGSGVTQPVSGTVTANLGATDNDVLDSIDTNTTTLAGAVSATNVKVSIEADNVGIGGGTQYTEDAAAAADPVGNALIMVRDDALSGQTTTDGDNVAARGTDKGELYVKHVDAIPITDNAGSITVDGTVTANPASGTIDTVTTVASVTAIANALPAGDNNIGNVDIVTVPAPLSTTGGGTEATALRVTLANDSTGVVSIDDNAGSLTVDGTVAVSSVTTSITPGTAAANLGKAEDAGHTSGDVGVMSLAVSAATATARAGTAGDYQPLSVSSSNGRLFTSATVDAALPAGTNSVGNVGLVGRTSGGMSIFRSIDIDETEEAVKASAGQVFSITAFNTTAAPLFLKFYNGTVASVVVGTTTPVLTFVVPGNADSDGSGFVWNNEIGFAFGTAITVACTTGVADNDTGAPGANACIVNVGYV